MSKLFLLANFLVVTPFLLIFTIALTMHFSHQKLQKSLPFVSFAEPDHKRAVLGTTDHYDPRVETIRKFFIKHKSPLEPFAENIVQAADTYGVDFRLLPAIAMQESNLCKKAPKDSYNCWGFGIYGKTTKKFDSYPNAIEAVTKTIAKEYHDKGLESPEEIMAKYTPSSNGSWAKGVTFFMEAME